MRAASLPEIQSVYVLTMANGFDQYLVNRLTSTGTFQVVADPKRAQAVFTDRLGEAFEQKLDELYPPPPPPEPPKPSKKEGEEEEEEKTAEPKESKFVRLSTFGRGKGTFFLVDVQSRQVLWSTYAKPKDNTPARLDKNADLVVNRLLKSLSPK